MNVELSETFRPFEKTGMRYHELAVQRWCNTHFFVKLGYPIPVVMASPMDAYASFNNLWSASDNPFKYLQELRDDKGTPLYEPYPSPARYPLISIYRQGWGIRSDNNYSKHRWRRLSWPTLTTSGTITMSQLGNVLQAGFPVSMNYRFQLTFLSRRPDTLAEFLGIFVRQFARTGGQSLQTWIPVSYPYFGIQPCRLFVQGDISNLTPEEANNDEYVEFRLSMDLVLEGYDVDTNLVEVPAVWKLVLNSNFVTPAGLEHIYTQSKDLRTHRAINPDLASRTPLPPFD